MEKPVKISYVRTVDDITAANKFRWAAYKGLKVWIIIAGVVLFVNLYFQMEELLETSTIMKFIVSFISLAVLLFCLFVFWSLAPTSWASRLSTKWLEKPSLKTDVIFDRDKVKFMQLTKEGTIPDATVIRWDGVKKAGENENYIFICENALRCFAIPKRSFSGDDTDRVKQAINSNVPEKRIVTEKQKK